MRLVEFVTFLNDKSCEKSLTGCAHWRTWRGTGILHWLRWCRQTWL